jgi:putative ABC transport system permease protein
LRDPSLVIVSRLYTNGPDGRPGTHGVGDTLTMRSRTGNLSFTIIAVQKQLYLGGIFLAKPVVEANFDSVSGFHLLHVREGADPVAVARAVESTQEDVGMDAAGIAQEAGEFLQSQRQLYLLFEVYLGLGLVLGIASLGIITARSVLERRQEVGMLRAIGLPRAMVFRSFLVEGLFIVTIGAAVGVGIGVVVAYGVHQKSLASLGLPFVIPWVDLAVILVVAYVATLAATLGPARQAARLAPAEAIRYIE